MEFMSAVQVSALIQKPCQTALLPTARWIISQGLFCILFLIVHKDTWYEENVTKDEVATPLVKRSGCCLLSEPLQY